MTQRELLLEEIYLIVERFFEETYEGDNLEEQVDLAGILCDAVCKHFPAN